MPTASVPHWSADVRGIGNCRGETESSPNLDPSLPSVSITRPISRRNHATVKIVAPLWNRRSHPTRAVNRSISIVAKEGRFRCQWWLRLTPRWCRRLGEDNSPLPSHASRSSSSTHHRGTTESSKTRSFWKGSYENSRHLLQRQSLEVNILQRVFNEVDLGRAVFSYFITFVHCQEQTSLIRSV